MGALTIENLNGIKVIYPDLIEIGEIRKPGETNASFVPVAYNPNQEVWYKQSALASFLLGCWRGCQSNFLLDKCPDNVICNFEHYQGLDDLQTTPKDVKQEVKNILDDFQDSRGKNTEEGELVLGCGAWIKTAVMYGGLSRKIKIFEETVDLGVWQPINIRKTALFVRRNNGAPYNYTWRRVQIVPEEAYR